jgi:hypothetical protein
MLPPHFHVSYDLGDLAGRTIFRDRLPRTHSVVPITVLTGRDRKLAAPHLVLEFGFVEFPNDYPISPADLHNHGPILIGPTVGICNWLVLKLKTVRERGS